MSRVIYSKDVSNDNLYDRPYARFNIDSELTLSTTWQRLDWAGTSSLNANIFPVLDGETDKAVDWDSINDKFTFNRSNLVQYNVLMNFEFESGFRPAEIDMRFVIPSSTPIYFPLPDTLGYHTLTAIERRDSTTATHNEIIRTTQVLRDNGLAIELRSDITGVLTPIKLKHAIIQIYPR